MLHRRENLGFLLFSVHLFYLFSHRPCLLSITSCSLSKILLQAKCFHLLYSPLKHLRICYNQSYSHSYWKQCWLFRLRCLYGVALWKIAQDEPFKTTILISQMYREVQLSCVSFCITVLLHYLYLILTVLDKKSQSTVSGEFELYKLYKSWQRRWL